MNFDRYFELSSLGRFSALDIEFNWDAFTRELITIPDSEWHPYNRSKPENRRKGLSLFSLDGGTSGEIDLNSLLEYNRIHGTNYSEMSFCKPTPHWRTLSTLSKPFAELEPFLGRSHLIGFETGGFFPPHRDLGETFRLISMLGCRNDNFILHLDHQIVHYEAQVVYFMDTRLAHALFNMGPPAYILVLNVALTPESIRFVQNHLDAK